MRRPESFAFLAVRREPKARLMIPDDLLWG